MYICTQHKCSAKDVTTYSTENVETQHRQFEQGVQQCGDKWWTVGATMLHVLHTTKQKLVTSYYHFPYDILPWKT
jgi:hypothetical protein